MTPGNTDLLCRCGKHSARFHEGKAKKGKKVKHWIADCTTQLYPWIADCTTLRGAIHLMRSDGCAGQMKSGRHFRFISNFQHFSLDIGYETDLDSFRIVPWQGSQRNKQC